MTPEPVKPEGDPYENPTNPMQFLMNIRGTSSLEDFQKEMMGRHFSSAKGRLLLDLITHGIKKAFVDGDEVAPLFTPPHTIEKTEAINNFFKKMDEEMMALPEWQTFWEKEKSAMIKNQEINNGRALTLEEHAKILKEIERHQIGILAAYRFRVLATRQEVQKAPNIDPRDVLKENIMLQALNSKRRELQEAQHYSGNGIKLDISNTDLFQNIVNSIEKKLIEQKFHELEHYMDHGNILYTAGKTIDRSVLEPERNERLNNLLSNNTIYTCIKDAIQEKTATHKYTAGAKFLAVFGFGPKANANKLISQLENLSQGIEVDSQKLAKRMNALPPDWKGNAKLKLSTLFDPTTGQQEKAAAAALKSAAAIPEHQYEPSSTVPPIVISYNATVSAASPLTANSRAGETPPITKVAVPPKPESPSL